jgi:hypothetical protein
MSLALWGLALAALAATCAYLVAQSRRSALAIPLAGHAGLRPALTRSAVLWLVLAAAALAGTVALAPLSYASTPGRQILPADSTAMIVLDLSDSTTKYFTQIAGTLDSLTRESNRRLGLVVVSNTAYVALPPTTPVEGLRGWLHTFIRSPFLDYPWKGTFSRGTELSKGLVTARAALRRAQVRNPHVILITDLSDDPFDLQRLSGVVTQYQRERIDLRIVSLGENQSAAVQQSIPNWHNAAYIARAASTLARPTTAEGVATHRPALLAVALLLGLVALAMAGYEHLFHPLRWRTDG